jgi:hypothetical protein
MSTKRSAVLRIGSILILVLALFPPWRIQSYAYAEVGGSAVPCEIRAGYSFLFSPPSEPSKGWATWPRVGEALIDLPLLLAEWAIVAIVAVLALSLFRSMPLSES